MARFRIFADGKYLLSVDDFEGNANISVAIKPSSRVSVTLSNPVREYLSRCLLIYCVVVYLFLFSKPEIKYLSIF